MIFRATRTSPTMYFPLPYTGDKRMNTSTKVKINMSSFDHKEYPWCKKCQSRYVPIDGKCFKCVIKGT